MMQTQEKDEALIIGRNPVLEALKAEEPLDTIYMNGTGGSLGRICTMAKSRGIVVKNVTEQKLSQMANGAAHQGVIATGACASYVTLEDLLDISRKKGTAPFLIVCDEIEDPHNLGAIIRTAETAGADGVIIPKRRSAGLTAVVAKTSAGAVSHLPVARVANLPSLLKRLKEEGLWIFGSAADGTTSLYAADLKGPAALVIGSEGSGMSRLVSETCDFLVRIPMKGKLNSLNASAAAAILLYEALRQRLGS